MKHLISLTLLCSSFLLLAGCGAKQKEGNHAHQEGHTHAAIQAGEAVPSVDLVVHEDPVAGYNLQVITQNFAFAPQSAGGADVPGEGHAHLWINGEKIGRIYAEWSYMHPLPPGEYEVAVNLNTNSHAALVNGDEEVMATASITVPGGGLGATLTGLLPGFTLEDTCEQGQ